jgi:hypothetical protein
MEYEKPTVTAEKIATDPPLEQPAALILVAVLVVADAGTWVWATRRITRATHSSTRSAASNHDRARLPLRVVVLPAESAPRPRGSGLIQIR